MKYKDFDYIFPPRPEIKAPRRSIENIERLGFIAQPKLNGSCAILFTDGEKVKFMSRHKDYFTKENIPLEELKKLNKGKGLTVLVGENLNKSKRDSTGHIFNDKFVVFDILIHNGEYLLGKTFDHRQKLLDDLYETSYHDKWLSKISDNVLRVKNVDNANDKWEELTSIDMYEGFVFKKKLGTLESGIKRNNNTTWQVKIRKPSKLYTH